MTPRAAAKASVGRRRLANQWLIDAVPRSPADVVSWLGAVQAQDYAGVRWGIAQRASGMHDRDIDDAMASGSIIRTHILRPTWHFVAPADIRWMLALTAPRVRAAMAYVCRTLGLDDAIFAKSNKVLARALDGGKRLTRAELGGALARARIVPVGDERVAHLMMRAELEAIVCSGARRGKQFTYALFDDVVPLAPAVPRDEALATLATRYFTSHGPATVKDFSWWSGLTVTDARRAAAAAGVALVHETIADAEYLCGAQQLPPKGGSAQLLPTYDEYVVAYADRTSIFDDAMAGARRTSRDVIFGSAVVVDGQIVGEWTRKVWSRVVAVDVRLFLAISRAASRAVAAAAERHAEFLGLGLDLTIG